MNKDFRLSSYQHFSFNCKSVVKFACLYLLIKDSLVLDKFLRCNCQKSWEFLQYSKGNNPSERDCFWFINFYSHLERLKFFYFVYSVLILTLNILFSWQKLSSFLLYHYHECWHDISILFCYKKKVCFVLLKQ